jgi:hypothetical protein
VNFNITKDVYRELSMAIDMRYIDQYPLADKLISEMCAAFFEEEIDHLLEPTELW